MRGLAVRVYAAPESGAGESRLSCDKNYFSGSAHLQIPARERFDIFVGFAVLDFAFVKRDKAVIVVALRFERVYPGVYRNERRDIVNQRDNRNQREHHGGTNNNVPFFKICFFFFRHNSKSITYALYFVKTFNVRFKLIDFKARTAGLLCRFCSKIFSQKRKFSQGILKNKSANS